MEKQPLSPGGGSGLGQAIAKCMALAGASVVLVGRREQVLRNAAESIGKQAHFIVHDITQLDGAEGLIEEASHVAGAEPGILVNNAGIHLKQTVVETTPEDFQNVLTTHICAAHALNRAVIPRMLRNGGGVILLTASMASLFGLPLLVAYSAAKSAYLGMTRSMASELSSHGIRVNAIAPGWIETPCCARLSTMIRFVQRRFWGAPPWGASVRPMTSAGRRFIWPVQLQNL